MKNRILRKMSGSEDPTSLFQLTIGEGQHAFWAHGLGGGSLINAGVFLETTERTMQMSAWPRELRENPSVLKKYYARAADMLQPSPYPEDQPKLRKEKHLKEQAKYLGKDKNFYRVPLTTFFSRAQNAVGVAMHPNGRTGHECTGLNDGSKNSLTVTYLSDAWNWGAEIFCGCEVRYIEKATDGKGYIVYFSWHCKGRAVFEDEFKSQLFWVRANEFCFLGAGALGTTEILLRSKRYGLSMSPMVGRKMSGNGDLLVFGYNGTKDINGLAGDSLPGPTITAAIDNRDDDPQNPLGGYLLEDGCIPAPFAPVLQAMLTLQTIKNEASSFLWHPRQQLAKSLAALKSIIKGPYAPGGAIQRTSTYLVMSHDSNELTLTLEDDKPHFQGTAEGQSRSLAHIKKVLNRAVCNAGANMGYSYFYGRHQEEVSVHVLGGANMSCDGTGREGVTDHVGQVFTGHGRDVYPRLVCIDASVIPTSLGVNPLATITALAERSVSLVAEGSGTLIDLETGNRTLEYGSTPMVSRPKSSEHGNDRDDPYDSIGWQFTEVLDGYISIQPSTVSIEACEAIGKASSSTMRMALTVVICHKRGTLGQYKGICSGTVSCSGLSQRTMKIESGSVVKFFVPDNKRPDSTSLTYTLQLISVEGRTYTLRGYKTIDSQVAFSIGRVWKATTTVSTRIIDTAGNTVGCGVLRISPYLFQRQMRTFRTTGDFVLSSLLPLLTFWISFLLHLCMFFFRPLMPFRIPPTAGLLGSQPKPQPSAVHKVRTRDGVTVLLEVYKPGSDTEPDTTPILFLPGITGVKTQHSIFALPFQDCSMVEYFTSHNHTCYVLTPRWSFDSDIANKCTVYDSRLDIAAAVAFMASHEDHKPYVIAHCQGSVALGMALLDGTMHGSQLLGIAANSVFINQVFGYWNSIKAWSPVLIRLYEFLGGPYFPITFPTGRSVFQKALDLALCYYPIPNVRDCCTSPECHRSSFAFGLLWNHKNLNRQTHENIGTFFNGTSTRILEHITQMGMSGSCLDNDRQSLLTDENINRLRDLPILLISGSENEVFKPESTLRDYEMLRRRFGERLYRRFLVEGYGHIDPVVGRAADGDVYWKIKGHLQCCLEQYLGSRSIQCEERK
ncbi:FAD/NAD(P)-binding domain-containing protein [Aspergillus ambiguus]|uniref:FAD/NAD(P)-binding domain-containing protein n=1 Tax=Aspergillus ambiguus TaxID=176160 RepID=UPI003CCCE32D